MQVVLGGCTSYNPGKLRAALVKGLLHMLLLLLLQVECFRGASSWSCE